jgi:hypothetical protein
MSFREKTAWISLVSMGSIYCFYFWSILRHPQFAGAPFAGLLLTTIALVVVQSTLTIAAAIFSPKDAQAPRDERERLIELRATRVAYAGLAMGIVFACFFGALNPPIIFKTNSLLLILVTAELLRCATQIIQYRRSA